MGLKYVLFRLFFTLKSKLGFQKLIYPINPKIKKFVSLENWKNELPPFFFQGKKNINLVKIQSKILKENYLNLKKGKHLFFNENIIELGHNYDWITNPINNYKYDIKKHWTHIDDFSLKSGDIKYVWEKSRFCYLYDIILYDYNFDDDQSIFVFNEIENFIDKNPINLGPNYKCSQEISLRVFNWIFAIYYYKDSKFLNDDLFLKIMNSIYWQVHHVYNNINYSRYTVRNNHALTETLLIYASAKLFPFFPNVSKWSQKAKKWFEKEIEYQIYPDGSFLQFSMNYHRVAIQLLTWAIQFSKINNDYFNPVVYERASKSLNFLDACIDCYSGKMPNYGLNDGSLFFKLTTKSYYDFRPQLDDLRSVLNGYTYYNSVSHSWYGVKTPNVKIPANNQINKFSHGGYYIINDGNTKTFIRCGKYKDRPYQSDNLHLDLWVNGKNILRDSGSYRYNTSKEFIKYFNGCEGHNTVGISGEDQMLKGNRFIWNYWVKNAEAKIKKSKDKILFDGKFEGFKQIKNGIFHKRKVTKLQNKLKWTVDDKIEGVVDQNFFQYWHYSIRDSDKIIINCIDENNKKINPLVEEKWYSSTYGKKESSLRVTFKNNTGNFKTTIVYKE